MGSRGNVTRITALAGLLALSPALVSAQPVVDGTVDTLYGAAKAFNASASTIIGARTLV